MALPGYLEDTAKDYAKQIQAFKVPIETSKFTGGLDASGQRAAGPGITGLNPYVAQLDPLQQSAISRASAGVESYLPYLQAAQTNVGAAGTAQAGLGALTGKDAYKDFMSPYQQDVIDTSLQAFDTQAAQQQQALRDAALGVPGAFGGGREGVQQAQYQSQSDLNRAALQAQLMQQNFGQAQNAFANQQARQQSVSQLLGGIGQTAGMEAERYSKGIGAFGSAQSQLATLGQQLTGNEATTLGQLGSMRQRQSQVELDAARQSQLQQAYEPFQRISWSSDIFKPSIGSAGSTLTREVAPSPSPWSQALGAGMVGFGLQNKLGNPFSGLWSTES